MRGVNKAQVIETVCQGCGILRGNIPQGAIQLSHSTDNQILAEVNALCQSWKDKELRIVGFLCNWCSYGGADTAGVARATQPTDLRIIRVPLYWPC